MRATCWIILLLVACGGPPRAYEGDKRPESETARATVRYGGEQFPWPHKIRYDARFSKVDGKSVRETEVLVILAGKHEIEVAWKRRIGSVLGPPDRTRGGGNFELQAKGKTTVLLHAEAGKRYVIEWGEFPADPNAAPPMKFVLSKISRE